MYAVFSRSLKCAWNVKTHVASAACVVPLRGGVRYLDRFSAYGPLVLAKGQYAHSVSFFCNDSVCRYQPRRKVPSFEGYIYVKIRDGAKGFQFWECQNRKAGCLGKSHFKGKQRGEQPPTKPSSVHHSTSYVLHE